MKDTTSTLIDLLDRTPAVVRYLLDQIPADRHDVRRVEGQWSVKEWLCHLADAQGVLLDRFAQFESENDPLIADYEPPPQSDTRYVHRDLETELQRFTGLRADTVRRFRGYDEAFWARTGRHESFSPYSTRILLGHMLNVDYAHLFGMENTGLAIPGATP